MSDVFFRELEACRMVIEDALENALPPSGETYEPLLESMRYSLIAGGKRIRAIICMKFCEAAGGKIEAAIPAACAIEMLHSYTLIHDDLPCMDDDDMRRGKPSNHIKFGEFTATLAGDALQAYAFETVLKSKLPPDAVVKMAQVLAENSGPHGVCGGQYLDLSSEGKDIAMGQLLETYLLKTSALVSAGAQMGAIAGGGTVTQIYAAKQYAKAVGLAFQARDDILDLTATAEKLGKPIGSDKENQKTTLASLLGIEKCKKLIQIETENALQVIDGNFENAKFLKSLAKFLVGREF